SAVADRALSSPSFVRDGQRHAPEVCERVLIARLIIERRTGAVDRSMFRNAIGRFRKRRHVRRPIGKKLGHRLYLPKGKDPDRDIDDTKQHVIERMDIINTKFMTP